jgi:Tol biopolymer transport system component
MSKVVRWKSIALAGERRLTAGLVHHRWPAWSPDGNWVAFAVGDGGDAAWVIADRRGRVARTLAGPADGGASFGPARDGCPLAFGRSARLGSEIWLTPGGGVPAVRLLGGDGRVYREPAWSPDGALLAFACGEQPGGPTQLMLLEVSTGRRRRLTADPTRSDGRPAFSPDGDVVFFEGDAPGDVGVYALHIARNELARVTAAGTLGRRPAPLSQSLVVVEQLLDEKGPIQLVLVDRESGRARPLGVDGGPEQREPSAHLNRRGKVRLAYTALSAAAGELPRFDVCTARLKGLTLVDAAVEQPTPEPTPEPAPEPAPAGDGAQPAA